MCRCRSWDHSCPSPRRRQIPILSFPKLLCHRLHLKTRHTNANKSEKTKHWAEWNSKVVAGTFLRKTSFVPVSRFTWVFPMSGVHDRVLGCRLFWMLFEQSLRLPLHSLVHGDHADFRHMVSNRVWINITIHVHRHSFWNVVTFWVHCNARLSRLSLTPMRFAYNMKTHTSTHL